MDRYKACYEDDRKFDDCCEDNNEDAATARQIDKEYMKAREIRAMKKSILSQVLPAQQPSKNL